MKTYFDCIPYYVRQALDSVRLATDDEAVQERLLRELLREISEMDLRQSLVSMDRRIHLLIQKMTGEHNSYSKKKKLFNQIALRIYPKLMSYVERSDNLMETALRLAIAGNVIDLGLNGNKNEIQVNKLIEYALISPLIGDVDGFFDAISKAEKILYLADNAGEIFFDRLLLTQLPLERITVAVKSFSVNGSATVDDARLAGINRLVEVIDNQAEAPGTVLHECSKSFRLRFKRADLIIAKGQGNYETLSQVEKDIFFLFQAKCPLIASDLDCRIGSLILHRSIHTTKTVGQGDRITGTDEETHLEEAS